MSIFGFYEVPQGHTIVMERLGKYEGTLQPGLNSGYLPFVYSPKNLADWEGIASKSNYLMELTEQQIETHKRKCQTKDSVSVDASAIIAFKIYDPAKAVYSVDRLPQAIQEVCLNVLRSQIGLYSFDELFSQRALISKKITEELHEKVNEWGVKLLGVEVGSLEYPHEIDQALQKKRVAQAEKDAKMISIETEALAAIKASETLLKKAATEAETALIKAKAHADSINIESIATLEALKATKNAEIQHLQKLVDLLGKDQAAQIVTSQKAVDGMCALGGNNNSKVVMLPTDFKGMVKLVS